MRKIATIVFTALLVTSIGVAAASDNRNYKPEAPSQTPLYEHEPTCYEDQWDNVPDGPDLGWLAVDICEGEHWDGSDTTGTDAGCTDTRILDPSRIDQATFALNHCGKGQDANNDQDTQRPDIFQNGATDAVHLRVACRGSPGWANADFNTESGACFIGFTIWGLGRANTHLEGYQVVVPRAGATPDTAGHGWAGVAVYLRDDSDQLAYNPILPLAGLPAGCNVAGGVGNFYACNEGNALATIVNRLGITQGKGVGEEGEPENDGCTHLDYEERNCVRDNTAVSVWVFGDLDRL